MNDLFRPEAVAHARGRLAGEVSLVAPLPLRVFGLLLAAVVFVAVTFAAWATYARKASVTGWLVPDLGFIRATTPASGFVTEILVKEGQHVEQGQRLAEIKVSTEIAGGNVGEALASKLRQESEAVTARDEARIAKLEAEIIQTRTRIANLTSELGQVDQQINLQERRIALAQKAYTDSEQLAGRGLISQRELEQRRSAALAAEQELATQRRQFAAIQREIADLTSRVAAIPIEISGIRAEARSSAAALGQRLIEAEQRRAVYIVAPSAGSVAALPIARGQPVLIGGTLAVIIPDGGKIEAELLTPSRAIGFIEPGQEVQLQLQAFPYQRFGLVHGRVKSISSTVMGPSEISIPGLAIQEPVFRVRVALVHEFIDAYGKIYPLQPGMLLSAEIVFDRRTLLQWLFDPLYAVAKRA
jgi:membrane fusion protein